MITCEKCGETDLQEFLQAPHLKVARSGVQPSSPDGPAVYWFEGVLTCPTCRHEMEVSDSN